MPPAVAPRKDSVGHDVDIREPIRLNPEFVVSGLGVDIDLIESCWPNKTAIEPRAGPRLHPALIPRGKKQRESQHH